MNILISLDDGYVKYYLVALTSLLENNINKEIVVYLFHTDRLSLNSVEKINTLVTSYGKHCHIQKITLDCFSSIPDSPWPKEALIRLIAFSLVPDKVDRLLYLDGDIIVNRGLSEFYNIDFEDNCFAACEDKAISRKKTDLYKTLGMDENDVYFNAGVLLINVEKLRKAYTYEQIVEYICKNVACLPYPDQDILNKLFYRKIKAVPGIKYNCIVGQYHWTREKEIMQNTVIMHFAGETTRPTNIMYRHHYSSAVPGDVWWKYARKCGYQAEYYKWKILNTIRVKPWQFCYRISRIFLKSEQSVLR